MPPGTPTQSRRAAALAVLATVGVFACDNPQPPEPCASIPEQTITVGESVTVQLCFDDPNGDMLDHRVVSSDPAVATAAATGSTVTVTAVSPGIALVTMIVTDPTGLKAQQSFRVVVPNRAPATVGTIPDRELMVGDSASLDVSGYFSEPDGQSLGYVVAVSDSSRLAATVEAAVVTIVAVAKGDVVVTVTATDPGGLSATQSFLVTVPNRPPVAVDSIAARIIEVDRADTLDVSAFFTDPDGDPLSYAAAVSDGAVVGASVSGSAVVVTGLAKGEAEVTVTATDDEGLSAEQRFAVTVPNRPPLVADTIPARTLFRNEADTLMLARHFTDPDGDVLTWDAEASDSGVVALELSAAAGTLAVTAIGQGEAEVTVTATDPEGLSAAQSFLVTVPNRGPVVADEIPAQTLYKRETAPLDLSDHFSDPDGDALAYIAETTDPSVARATVTGTTLTIQAGAQGEAVLTVTATDPAGLSASQSFTVTVLNRAPTVTTPIPEQTIAVGTPDTVDLALHLTDPDGDALEYTAETSSRTVVRVTLRGSRVILRAQRKGTAQVSVTATDPDGLTAEHSFTVVVANQAPTVVRRFPELTIARDEVLTFPISGYFSDPDGDPLTYSGRTANPGIARASVSGVGVILTGVATGETTLTLTATDPDGLSTRQTARVTVAESVQGPEAVGSVNDASLVTGEDLTLKMDSYFTHPGGDPLAYTAGTADSGVATAAMTGATLRVTAHGSGTTTVTVVATDPNGRSATQRFTVTVTGGGGGGGSGFSLSVRYHPSATATVRGAVDGAVAVWESILSATDFTDGTLDRPFTCTLNGVVLTLPAGTFLDDIVISVGTASIDGSGSPSVVAKGGICAIRDGSKTPAIGAIVFDSADLDRLERVGLLTTVAIHEVGHVLGIGTSSLWSGFIRSDRDPHFAGTLATAAFNAAGGSGYSGAKVPVQSFFDTAHWRESVLGTEIMTPTLQSAANPLSAITIRALADMGYSVDASLADGFSLASGDAADLAGPLHTVDLHGDFEQGPIMVIDASGNVVRVIPGRDGR